MVEVPRYGVHNNIKYSPRRTLVRYCKKCDKPFIPSGRRDLYCEVCRLNRRIKTKRAYENKREKRNEYLAELKRKGRANGTTKSHNKPGTTNSIRAPKENATEKDWKEMENAIKKLKRETLGGYQDYNDIEEEDDDYV
jgi:DNA-directed RNA polymerase subunit M/transcription elongation factor TFIIS